MIDLKEFIEWYKSVEVDFWAKHRKFREPKLKDLDNSVEKLLEINCIEWDWWEFVKYLNEEMPISKQKDFLNTLLQELGLMSAPTEK